MSPIATLVVEDEKPARERLLRALETISEVSVVGVAVHGADAVEQIRALKPDLVLLDVQIPVLDGFQVLEQLPHRPAVVFTTAYDEYALRAFEVHAVDYLLKPYDRARLQQAIERATARVRSNGDSGLGTLLQERRRINPYLSRLTIRSGRTFRVLPVADVEFFRAEDGLVFWVDGTHRYLVEESLTRLETRLDPANFMRIHRSAIAHLDKIARVITLGRGRLAAEFESGARVDVGRTHTDRFRSVFDLPG
ncbi:MAG: LytTR family DNA-binding domain-containing protein [Spirochaeta sp.]|jgi:two-component system LytT family response regulator|nr:LytTR family DNA-binding domain-containing protein [Spirochaeta sp.]